MLTMPLPGQLHPFLEYTSYVVCNYHRSGQSLPVARSVSGLPSAAEQKVDSLSQTEVSTAEDNALQVWQLIIFKTLKFLLNS